MHLPSEPVGAIKVISEYFRWARGLYERELPPPHQVSESVKQLVVEERYGIATNEPSLARGKAGACDVGTSCPDRSGVRKHQDVGLSTH